MRMLWSIHSVGERFLIDHSNSTTADDREPVTIGEMLAKQGFNTMEEPEGWKIAALLRQKHRKEK